MNYQVTETTPLRHKVLLNDSDCKYAEKYIAIRMYFQQKKTPHAHIETEMNSFTFSDDDGLIVQWKIEECK